MYTRETFEQVRAGVRQRERRDGLLLALVSVGLGLVQLGLHPWVDSRFPRRSAVAIEAGIFLGYAVIVIWLLWRMQRHKRLGAPRCPQCARALQGMSERVAGATGRCDACGGQVLA